MIKRKKINFKKTLKKLPKIILKIFLWFIFLSILSVLLLKWINPPTTSIMIQRKIEAVVTFKDRQMIAYEWFSYDDISKQMAIAVVAAEDQNFPFHFGFDFEQIEKAIEQSNRGRKLRGASTITQQVAKNLFLWEGRSFIRKGFEAYFTVLLELLWSKERILEVYLNIIETGDMIFGVGAASQIYFKKTSGKANKKSGRFNCCNNSESKTLLGKKSIGIYFQKTKLDTWANELAWRYFLS